MTVATVLGDVKFENLGITLTHEHFNVDFNKFHVKPPNKLATYFNSDINLSNSGYIRQYPYGSKSNINFNGKDVDEAVLEEMNLYKKYGGGTIVENTSHGLKRNLDLMVKVSQASGVHIIAGTGHYVAAVQPQSTLNQNLEQLCKTIRDDMMGYELNSLKCGFIGEVGSTWPIDDFEKRAIQATAIVQSEFGCAVSFHPGRNENAPAEILRLYAEAGGKIEKADMSHLDRTIKSVDKLLEFAKIGSYCQFDLFGVETSFYQLEKTIDMPSDAQRIDSIKALIDEGFEDKILVSHDIHTKHRLTKFGGHGYSHLLNTVLPQMEIKGITKDNINKITVTNPAVWLCK